MCIRDSSKYRFIEIGKRLDIFSDFIVNEIVCYLESGYFDTTYLQQYFAAEDVSLNSWDYLYDYWRLDNEEYEKHYEETVRYYFADKSVDLKELFVIISILSVLYSDNLVHVSEEDIIAQGKHSIDRPVSYTHLDVYKRQVPVWWQEKPANRATFAAET